MEARANPSRSAKDHIEYGARLVYRPDKKDRKILRRINHEPLLLRVLDWLVRRSR